MQRAALLLLHHLHPTILTRTELHRQLVDASTSDDAVQRAIDDLTAVGVIDLNATDGTVRLPLAVLSTLDLVEK